MSGNNSLQIFLVAKKFVFKVTSACVLNGVGSSTFYDGKEKIKEKMGVIQKYIPMQICYLKPTALVQHISIQC